MGFRDQRFHFFFFNDTATTEIYTLSLHDALPILFITALVHQLLHGGRLPVFEALSSGRIARSEEHTSELQSPCNLVCRLLLEKKKMLFCATIAAPQCQDRARLSLSPST